MQERFYREGLFEDALSFCALHDSVHVHDMVIQAIEYNEDYDDLDDMEDDDAEEL